MKNNYQGMKEANDHESFSNRTIEANHSEAQGAAPLEEAAPSAPEANHPTNKPLTSASAIIFGIPHTPIRTSDDYREQEQPEDNLF